MSAVQLSFTLRTSSNVKTVHLLGSWDNYSGQLPLSKDTAKSGGWKGTFRFQGATLQAGQRYWYYYIMDGYHVSHDPAKPSTTEPTTGRSLNILDVPSSNGASAPASHKSRSATKSTIATGRSLSPSKIAHPKPSKPYASRGLREADYSRSPASSDIDELTTHLESASLSYSPYSGSPASSVGSSVSSRSDASSPESLSSVSSASSCRCNRFGITRAGNRVKLDCGGNRCGYSDDSSSGCESSEAEDSEEESEDEVVEAKPKYQEIRPRTAAAPVSSRRLRR
ncbi:hypothetical protein MMC25_002568 [Agyrium rufum]|nr:hypothetical protein [Agyrium rufum]